MSAPFGSQQQPGAGPGEFAQQPYDPQLQYGQQQYPQQPYGGQPYAPAQQYAQPGGFVPQPLAQQPVTHNFTSS